jgi:hypothetical protein
LRQAKKNGTKQELSSDQGAKPAVKSSLFVAIQTRESQEKRKEKRKQEGETPTDAYATARTSARARPIGGARLSAFHHGACCSERTPQLNSSHALPVKVLRSNGRYPFPAFVQCSGLVTRGPVIVPAGRVCRSRLGAAVTSRRAQEPSRSDQPSHRLTFLTSGMFGLMLTATAAVN